MINYAAFLMLTLQDEAKATQAFSQAGLKSKYVQAVDRIEQYASKPLYKNEGKKNAYLNVNNVMQKYQQSKDDSPEQYKAIQAEVSDYLHELFPARVWFVICGFVDAQNPPATTGNEDFKILNIGGKYSIYIFSIAKSDYRPMTD